MTSEIRWHVGSTLIAMAAFASGCQKPSLPEVDHPVPEVASPAKSTAIEPADLPESSQSAKDSPFHFTSMLATSGVTFRHTSGDSVDKAIPAANGSGIATLDFDVDGQFDLYFGNGTTFPIEPSHAGPMDECYRNRGEWRFQNVTKVTGLVNFAYTSGLAVGDYNNDGFPDLYVASVGSNHLYKNCGDGTFVDVASESSTDDSRWAVSVAFADIDNDGYLDLYVCNYSPWDFANNRFCGDHKRKIRMYCSPTLLPPEKDSLYRNQGDGQFDDASNDTGINNPPGRSQGVVAADLNADGLIDLYVANDINANALFMNSVDHHLQNRAEATGTAFDHLGNAQASMGLAVADFDRNGHFDIFATNYEKEYNALYENFGHDNFIESGTIRVSEGSLPNVGWGTAFSDFDLDAWPDLIVTNGHTDNNLELFGKEGKYLQPPGLWHNQNGSFSLVTSLCGEYFQQLHCGRALVTVDLDDDGDADVVIGHQDDQPALLRNDKVVETSPQSVLVQLIGRSANRNAIGSLVESVSEGLPSCQFIYGGGSYSSASDQRLIFACQSGNKSLDLNIRWPDGKQSKVGGLIPGLRYVIVQPVSNELLPLCLAVP